MYMYKCYYYYFFLCVPSSQAIEAFALMVKTTGQTLQAFGTQLAETELPNDAEATQCLLHSHTLKKDEIKVREFFLLPWTKAQSISSFMAKTLFLFEPQEDLQVALCQGRRLLEYINEPLQTDPEYSMTHDELENLATVQR